MTNEIYAISTNGRNAYRGLSANLPAGLWCVIDHNRGVESLIRVSETGERIVRGYHSLTAWGSRAAQDCNLAADTCYLANVKF